MIRVLLVEDDPVIRDTTCYFLKSQQNFEVVCAETGGDALSHAREKFDVILMDILLPDTNGVDLCQRLRSWHHCPIIFTSCLDDTDTIVHALEMGGDDFLAKPYNNKILLARIMANIRRVQMDGAEPSVNGYHCSAFTLDANSHSVEKDGRSVHLADMEYPSSSATQTPSSRPTSSTRRYGARKASAMCGRYRYISTTFAAR
jgi:DNA-binding response OmpR family regulator